MHHNAAKSKRDVIHQILIYLSCRIDMSDLKLSFWFEVNLLESKIRIPLFFSHRVN